jgi:hypothetical protein
LGVRLIVSGHVTKRLTAHEPRVSGETAAADYTDRRPACCVILYIMLFHAYFSQDDEEAVWFPERPPLTRANAVAGAEVWLDGVDALGDQFFESRKLGQELALVAIPDGGLARTIHNTADFEALQVVHARILENKQVVARARLERVQPLGEWARTARLSAADAFGSMLASMRPTADMLERLRRETLWLAPNRAWQKGEPVGAAMYLCRGADGTERFIVIGRSHAPCYLTVIPL